MIAAVGESLPFADESFDVVTTFQTLEHVADVDRCIAEMVRVLRPGGVLYLRAPDYNCFFEPHYRVPMWPKMPRAWAAPYLRWLGKPVDGLSTLNWTTERDTIASREVFAAHGNMSSPTLLFILKRVMELDLPRPCLLLGFGPGLVAEAALVG